MPAGPTHAMGVVFPSPKFSKKMAFKRAQKIEQPSQKCIVGCKFPHIEPPSRNNDGGFWISPRHPRLGRALYLIQPRSKLMFSRSTGIQGGCAGLESNGTSYEEGQVGRNGKVTG